MGGGSQIVQIIGQVTPIIVPAAPPPASVPPPLPVPPQIFVPSAAAVVAGTGYAVATAARVLPLMLPLLWERRGTVVVFDVPPGGDARPYPAGDGAYRLPLRWRGVPVLSLAAHGLEAVSPDGGRTWQPATGNRWEAVEPVPGRRVRFRLSHPTPVRVNDGWAQTQAAGLRAPARAVRLRALRLARAPGLLLLAGAPGGVRYAFAPENLRRPEVCELHCETDTVAVTLEHVAQETGRWPGGRLILVVRAA